MDESDSSEEEYALDSTSSEDEDEKSEKERVAIQALEKAKAKPVAFGLRTNVAFNASLLSKHEQPHAQHMISFANRSFLHIKERFSEDWYIGRLVKIDSPLGFIPSIAKINKIRNASIASTSTANQSVPPGIAVVSSAGGVGGGLPGATTSPALNNAVHLVSGGVAGGAAGGAAAGGGVIGNVLHQMGSSTEEEPPHANPNGVRRPLNFDLAKKKPNTGGNSNGSGMPAASSNRVGPIDSLAASRRFMPENDEDEQHHAPPPRMAGDSSGGAAVQFAVPPPHSAPVASSASAFNAAVTASGGVGGGNGLDPTHVLPQTAPPLPGSNATSYPPPPLSSSNLKKKTFKKVETLIPYEVVPCMRPIILVGPALKGYEVTDMMQKALFTRLKNHFDGRIIITRVTADISQTKRWTTNSATGGVPDLKNKKQNNTLEKIQMEIARIFELANTMHLLVLDCDSVNHPSQVNKTCLAPILIYIKIGSLKVLTKLIKNRGKFQKQNSSVQTAAADKLLQCTPDMFDLILDQNNLAAASEALNSYLDAYWKATHPASMKSKADERLGLSTGLSRRLSMMPPPGCAGTVGMGGSSAMAGGGAAGAGGGGSLLQLALRAGFSAQEMIQLTSISIGLDSSRLLLQMAQKEKMKQQLEEANAAEAREEGGSPHRPNIGLHGITLKHRNPHSHHANNATGRALANDFSSGGPQSRSGHQLEQSESGTALLSGEHHATPHVNWSGDPEEYRGDREMRFDLAVPHTQAAAAEPPHHHISATTVGGATAGGAPPLVHTSHAHTHNHYKNRPSPLIVPDTSNADGGGDGNDLQNAGSGGATGLLAMGGVGAQTALKDMKSGLEGGGGSASGGGAGVAGAVGGGAGGTVNSVQYTSRSATRERHRQIEAELEKRRLEKKKGAQRQRRKEKELLMLGGGGPAGVGNH